MSEQPAMVYVVFGTTGEYSDHREWPVCAFADKQLAQRMVVLCDGEWRRIAADDDKDDYSSLRPEPVNKYDPNMQVNYTGTRYYYYELELRNNIEGDTNEQS